MRHQNFQINRFPPSKQIIPSVVLSERPSFPSIVTPSSVRQPRTPLSSFSSSPPPPPPLPGELSPMSGSSLSDGEVLDGASALAKAQELPSLKEASAVEAFEQEVGRVREYMRELMERLLREWRRLKGGGGEGEQKVRSQHGSSLADGTGVNSYAMQDGRLCVQDVKYVSDVVTAELTTAAGKDFPNCLRRCSVYDLAGLHTIGGDVNNKPSSSSSSFSSLPSAHSSLSNSSVDKQPSLPSVSVKSPQSCPTALSIPPSVSATAGLSQKRIASRYFQSANGSEPGSNSTNSSNSANSSNSGNSVSSVSSGISGNSVSTGNSGNIVSSGSNTEFDFRRRFAGRRSLLGYLPSDSPRRDHGDKGFDLWRLSFYKDDRDEKSATSTSISTVHSSASVSSYSLVLSSSLCLTPTTCSSSAAVASCPSCTFDTSGVRLCGICVYRESDHDSHLRLQQHKADKIRCAICLKIECPKALRPLTGVCRAEPCTRCSRTGHSADDCQESTDIMDVLNNSDDSPDEGTCITCGSANHVDCGPLPNIFGCELRQIRMCTDPSLVSYRTHPHWASSNIVWDNARQANVSHLLGRVVDISEAAGCAEGRKVEGLERRKRKRKSRSPDSKRLKRRSERRRGCEEEQGQDGEEKMKLDDGERSDKRQRRHRYEESWEGTKGGGRRAQKINRKPQGSKRGRDDDDNERSWREEKIQPKVKSRNGDEVHGKKTKGDLKNTVKQTTSFPASSSAPSARPPSPIVIPVAPPPPFSHRSNPFILAPAPPYQRERIYSHTHNFPVSVRPPSVRPPPPPPTFPLFLHRPPPPTCAASRIGLIRPTNIWRM